MPPERPKKLAIFGLEHSSGNSDKITWDAFPWNWNKEVNFHDYHIWLMYLPSLENDHQLLGSFVVDYVYRALMSGVRIYVLGDPRITISVGDSVHPFLYWTGFHFAWEERSGDTRELLQKSTDLCVRKYLENLLYWSYSFVRISENDFFHMSGLVQEAARAGELISLNELPLLKNRSGAPISFAVQLFSARHHSSYGITTTTDYEHIVFLPLVKPNPQDSLTLLLKSSFNITLAQQPPDWLNQIQAPGQEHLDVQLAQLNSEKNGIISQIAQYTSQRDDIRQCLSVLYQSNSALEIAVWNMLEELGAVVERPVVTNEEDGWITVRGKHKLHEGVLEIKSTTKVSFDEGGIKQLPVWVAKSNHDREKEHRGIFIGNSSYNKPPSERENPFHNTLLKKRKLSMCR